MDQSLKPNVRRLPTQYDYISSYLFLSEDLIYFTDPLMCNQNMNN